MLDEIKAKYPQGTSFVDGYNLNGQTRASREVNRAISQSGYTSTTHGCGGWAAMVSDYIFGQDGAPARKISVQDARPGDITVILNKDGTLKHVAVLINKPWHDDECEMWRWNTTDGATATGKPTDPYYIDWGMSGGAYDDGFSLPTDFYTRYPE